MVGILLIPRFLAEQRCCTAYLDLNANRGPKSALSFTAHCTIAKLAHRIPASSALKLNAARARGSIKR